jgi:hypothetical protein
MAKGKSNTKNQTAAAEQAPVVEQQVPAATLVVEERTAAATRKGPSTVKYPVAVTWITCINAMHAAFVSDKPTPSRKQLVAAAVENGVGWPTARTQVQAFLKASKGGTQMPQQLPRNVSLGA